MNNDQIIPTSRLEIDNPQVLDYVKVVAELAPLAGKVIELGHSFLALQQELKNERIERLEIVTNAEERRREIEVEMNRLEVKLKADLENRKKVIEDSMTAFKWMIENGLIDAAMILHERVVTVLADGTSHCAKAYNEENSGGQVQFETKPK